MRLPRRRFSLVILLAVAAAGCGGDGGAGTGGGPADGGSGAGGPVATVEVVETDFQIDPMEAEVAESGTIRVNLSNEGQTAHSLEIEAPEEEVVSDTLEPGESTTFITDLPAGEYSWYCPIANHRELGMDGSITVGGSGTGAGGTGDSSGSSEDEPGSGGGSPGY